MAPNSGALLFPESFTAKRLRCLLQTAKNCSTQVQILIVGPSGVGKSSLARTALRDEGFEIHRLDFRHLCHDDSITSIASVLAAFQGTEDGKPVAVLVDDLDFWAPAPDSVGMLSVMDIHIVAAISHALATISDSSHPFAFIATACDENTVHPALRYHGRLEHVFHLCPLSVEERTCLAKEWVARIRPKSIEDDYGGVDKIATHISVVTPGFVHSDLRRLFSALEQRTKSHRLDPLPPNGASSSKLQFDLSFWDTLKSVTPSLLTAATGAWTDASEVAPTNSLRGLDDEIQRFRECLAAVFSFSINTDIAKNKLHITANKRVLRALGTFRGLILHGPTGCGKTAMTRLAPSCLPQNSVNFINANATSIVSSVIGEAERKLAQLFSVASAIAPAVLIVENIDVLAPSREASSGHGGSATEAFNRLLSTFLTQIDGVHKRSEQAPVFVIATTRSLDLIDPALLRPGRFEIHIEVHPPDALARVQILQEFLKSRNTQLREGLGMTMRFNTDRFKADSHGWTAPDVLAFGREILIDEKISGTAAGQSSDAFK